jgi:hypothetical protein
MKNSRRIRLKKSTSYIYDTHNSVLRYTILYDHSSGYKNRYTVLVLNAEDPVIIGRELPLENVRSLILDYEHEAKKLSNYIGERRDVLLCMQNVIRKRYKLIGDRIKASFESYK